MRELELNTIMGVIADPEKSALNINDKQLVQLHNHYHHYGSPFPDTLFPKVIHFSFSDEREKPDAHSDNAYGCHLQYNKWFSDREMAIRVL